ncbi:hypothetical protein ACFVX9_35920 [Kitasatospora sp. NPDC058243]|uniref:hypothetical protein n=1 Tax=Kitasatospora sp. NPDC058243 TaxID=3346397 RepID=UPI0036D7F659
MAQAEAAAGRPTGPQDDRPADFTVSRELPAPDFHPEPLGEQHDASDGGVCGKARRAVSR